MIEALVTILWLFLPAGFANTAPVIANNIPKVRQWLDLPIDGGREWRGKRLLGENKKWRGLLAGIVMGAFVAAIQMILYARFSGIGQYTAGVDYGSALVLLMGAFIGAGSLIGDAVESFFKRQRGIAPGKSWVPFDQTDFVFGSMLFSLPFVQLSIWYYVLGLGIAMVLHPLFNIISWLLGLQPKPF